MNTGQTVYEQLQDILNKCIELGWKPFGIDTQVQRIGLGNRWGYIGGRGEPVYCSNHDLFSKDSGIMEYVEWKKEEDSFLIISGKGRDRDIWYHNSEYQYMIMGPMTAEEKCSYFVNNAIIPTK